MEGKKLFGEIEKNNNWLANQIKSEGEIGEYIASPAIEHQNEETYYAWPPRALYEYPNQLYNTITIPLAKSYNDLNDSDIAHFQELVPVIQEQTNLFELAIVSTSGRMRGVTMRGLDTHRLHITIPKDLVSPILHKFIYSGVFDHALYEKYLFTPQIKPLARGCFYDDAQSGLATIYKLNTEKFRVVTSESNNEAPKSLNVELKRKTALIGLYDKVAYRSSEEVKEELYQFIQKRQFCTSIIPAIRHQELQAVIDRLPDLKKELEDNNPEQKKFPKATKATALLGFSSGIITGFLAYHAYTAYKNGELPHVVKTKSIWAGLCGLLFGSFTSSTVWLNALKHRVFASDKDCEVYNQFEEMEKVYKYAASLAEEGPQADKKCAMWIQEARIMKELFEAHLPENQD